MTIRFICYNGDERYQFCKELTQFLLHLRKQGVRYRSQYFDIPESYEIPCIEVNRSLEIWIRYIGEDEHRKEILDKVFLGAFHIYQKYRTSARLEIE